MKLTWAAGSSRPPSSGKADADERLPDCGWEAVPSGTAAAKPDEEDTK